MVANWMCMWERAKREGRKFRKRVMGTLESTAV